MNILVLRLRDIKIPYPMKNKASSLLMVKHSFNCGEQFMMACKAWLFDTSQKASTLKAILTSKTPRDQKALGRQVQGFNDRVWTPASVEIVVASQIARAEVNQHLAQLYQLSGNRTFVEGSPMDRIWGAGIHYKQKAIENEKNWKGENRLGKCHGLAREVLRKQMADQESKIVETQKIACETGEEPSGKDLGCGEAGNEELKATKGVAAIPIPEPAQLKTGEVQSRRQTRSQSLLMHKKL